ncbi:MAG: TetR family transcriptional regulator [Enterocloster sp.]
MPIDTKEIIIQAFKQLVQEKRGKITIKEIVERCGITRKTFYYHFTDIYDLMDVIAEREMEELLNESAAQGDLKGMLKMFFSFMLQHRGDIDRLMKSSQNILFAKSMIEKVQTYFFRLIEERRAMTDISWAELELMVKFFSYGVLGISFDKRMQTEADIDMIVEYITCQLAEKRAFSQAK